MEYNFHDKVMLPSLGRDVVMQSVQRAENDLKKDEIAEKDTALDFYYNKKLDTHLAHLF